MTRTIAVISGKGGVGKTTLSLNIASALVRHYAKPTTVVDCNLTTSHLGLYLGSYHFPVTLNDVLRGDAAIGDAVYDVDHGLTIVPASVSLRDLDGIDIYFLKEKLQALERSDIVLLDSAPGLGREAIASLKAADEYLFVANPNILSVTDIIRCHEVCQEAGIRPLGTVLNMVHRDRYEISRADIERLTGIPVIASLPYHHDLRRSMALKAPLVSLRPKDKVSKQIINLSSVLAGQQIPSSRSGLLQALRFW